MAWPEWRGIHGPQWPGTAPGMGRPGRATGALQRALEEDGCAALGADERYARITESRGKGQFVVEEAPGAGQRQHLVVLQPRFVNALWMHRGTHVVVRLHGAPDTAVAGEIVRVLLREQIKTLKREARWPFPDADADAGVVPVCADEGEDDCSSNGSGIEDES